MPYNLLVEPFVPILRRSGSKDWITPSSLTAEIPGGNYAIEPAWPRPDLNIATYELLIGILSVAMAPGSHSQWRARWDTPPSPQEIEAALTQLKPAFNLDGEGARFMQEAGVDGEPNPIEALFIDTPGANGQKKNADVLTHRDRYGALSLPAAAITLYAMQAFAPSGGAGNRTSMRGGGPLTALVIPASEAPEQPMSFWHKLWANVAERKTPSSEPEKIFAWLNADLPLGSERGKAEVHEADPSFDLLHAFFGMPRRIRLVTSEQDSVCSLTGQRGPVVVTGFVQKPYGLNYGIWQHPLTPYRREKEGAEPYSTKPKAGRFGYRDWVAATIGDSEKELCIPAANVKAARRDERRRYLTANWEQANARIRVAGWTMNNMEAISYLVAEEPLHLAPIEKAEDLDEFARNQAEAGDLVQQALRRAVTDALYSSREKPGGNKGIFDQLRNDFYERTNTAFHDVLDEALGFPGEGGVIDTMAVGERWIKALRSTALALFDATAPVPLDDAEKAVRAVKARSRLLATFKGWNKTGAKLLAMLQLPAPERPKKKKEEEPT